MLTLHDVVQPALVRLVQELAPDEPDTFWKLFELLTRESLTLRIAGDGLRFSGICADGTPWQFCVSLGTASKSGLRYLTEIGMPGTSMSTRVQLARRRLDDVMGLLRLPTEATGVVDALFALLPKATDRLDALQGSIWVGVRAGSCGAPAVRLYANNEWGEELARWQRLTGALRRLRAAGFGRLLRENVSDLTQYFSPAGLASSLGRKTTLKLYLRPRAQPWEACARLTGRRGFQLPSDLLAIIERALGVSLASSPQRMLVLSIGGSADGEDQDLKLDLNGQYLFNAGNPPVKAVEALATACGIDPSPYRQMLATVEGDGLAAPVHDFIGVGGGVHGLRLNVYLRPAMPALPWRGCKPANPVDIPVLGKGNIPFGFPSTVGETEQ